MVLSIYSIYIPSPIIEVEVLCTSPCNNEEGYQINIGYSTPLINNLETEFFKDEDKEEGVGVIDFISRIV